VAIAVAVPPVVSSSPPGTSPGTPVAFGTAAPADRCDQPGPYELPHTDDTVHLDPADFTTEIDNPYWPMRVGTTWVYGETEPDGTRKRVEIVVTDRTRTIGGIEARVVHDVVTEGGEIIENTFDWYAQDAGGNLWYLGEFTREYENGVPVNTEGSWEHGVDGAQAGVAIPAQPRAGCSYRQEYYEGVAEDKGRILTTRDDVKVRGARYRDVLTTSDRVPLDPFTLEHKFYAPGVGPVLSAGVSPDGAREELIWVSGLRR